jgi:hypothetical protein
MELSKTIALTALVFVIVLVLTSGRLLGADTYRSKDPAAKANEASFQRSRTNEAARPAGTEYGPRKKQPRQAQAPACQYKPVMTERDMAACRAAKRK